MNTAEVIANLREQVRRANEARGNRAQLAALYVEVIGYDPFEDDPTIDPESVFEVLHEYPLEVCYSLGIHRAEVYE